MDGYPWLTLLLLLIPQCTAFYPYQRPSPTSHPSPDSKRGLDEYEPTSSAKSQATVRFPIKRRRVHHPDSVLGGSPVRRDNHYAIKTAQKPAQTDSIAIDQDGTDFSYFSALGFGSNNKTMYLLIDSGASSTWVMGSGCTTDACIAHSTFGNADSGSLLASDKTFDLAYGTGVVSGSIANDSINFGDFIVNISFGMASEVSDDFLSYPMDGILGLGRPNSEKGRYPTVFESIMAQQSLDSNQFGVHLSAAGEGEVDGELNFGAPDPSRYDGSLSFTHTVSSGPMWDIPLDDAGFNGDMCGFKGRTAIIDTGTSFMLLPPGDAEKIHSKIPGYQQDDQTFSVPCSVTEPLQIQFSGKTYNISASDYIAKSDGTESMCPTNIIGKQPFDKDQWLVGDVFLKNVYTVFDLDRNRVGFGIKDSRASSSSLPVVNPTLPISPTLNTASASIATSSGGSVATKTGFLLPESESAAAAIALATASSSPSTSTKANDARCLRPKIFVFLGTYLGAYLVSMLMRS